MSDRQSRVVFTDNIYRDGSREAVILSKHGIELVDARCHEPEELPPFLADADGLINQHVYLSKQTLAQAPNLKAIVRQGVGFDTVDLQGASELGVTVCNVPDYGSEDVASHAFSLMLATIRRIPQQNAAIRRGVWSFEIAVPAPDLMASTVGIVGLGRIGSAFARKALGFGFTVIACDPYIKGTELDVELVGLDDLLRTSDAVTVHVPLNDETRHLIGPPQLEVMKPTAHLVNTSRGPVVDLDGLAVSMEQKQIAGVALDVLDPEPFPAEHPLCKLDTVILTPHMAWYSEGSIVRMRDRTAETMSLALTNQRPPNVVNEDLLKSLGTWPWPPE